ncbi:DMT family transporter [Sedimentimonas flavescens]|uniref:DMT family transporter n=1 Tax=Sedimentimonas flavescens TaxID=2851012 RepID=UPI001C4A369A|nr:DMT family transporter [Sedimentimonas flavescens]MBW0157463.1 DMT family transporter [Sedimentimonas flavescens]
MNAHATSQDRPVLGVMWMLATTLSFTGVNVIVHHLGADLPAAQTSFVRFLWGILFVAPAIWQLRKMRFSARIWGLFGLRGAMQALAVLLWFYAMARIPIADVTAIGYLNPIVVTLGGALLLGEGFAWRRGAAIAFALIGALIILRPGLREVAPGHVAQLGAAIFFGLAYLVAKHLSAHAPASIIVALMTLSITLCLAPFAIAVWQPMNLNETLWLGLTAVFATLGHYCMTRAFACAPVTVTQPVAFLQLVFGSTAGLLLFGEHIDPYVLLGGGMIIGAVSYVTWREAKTKRRGVTPAIPQTKV